MKTATARTPQKANTRLSSNGRKRLVEPLISCEDVERLYDGRWVIMDIRQLNRWNQPEAGLVVFSADSKNELWAYGKQLLKENPKQRYYFFYAGDASLKMPGVAVDVTMAG